LQRAPNEKPASTAACVAIILKEPT
jgi:hypothetical protein